MTVDLDDFRAKYPHVELPAWLVQPGHMLLEPASPYANLETQAWVGAIHLAMNQTWTCDSKAVATRAVEIRKRFEQ